jgi:tetratricopeptide (TPR) repeat protein
LLNAGGDPAIIANCGFSLLQTAREYELGMAAVQSAVDANPNCFAIVVRAGIAHLHCGNIDKATAYLEQTLRLSPRDPESHYSYTGLAHVHMVLGNFREALDWATRSFVVNSTFDPTFWILIAGHAQLGEMAEAKRHLAAFRLLSPGVTVAGIRDGQCAKYPDRMAAILDGMRLAGLPEG